MPFIIYSVLRLALIVVLGVVLYAVGVRDLLLPLLAIVLALMVSYLVLGKQREAAAVYLAGRKKTREGTGDRFSRAVTEDAAVEDDQVDTAAAARSGVSEPAGPVVPDAQPAADQRPSDQHPSDRES